MIYYTEENSLFNINAVDACVSFSVYIWNSRIVFTSVMSQMMTIWIGTARLFIVEVPCIFIFANGRIRNNQHRHKYVWQMQYQCVPFQGKQACTPFSRRNHFSTFFIFVDIFFALSWNSDNYFFFQLSRTISTQNYNRKIIFECDSFRWSFHCFIFHFWFSPFVTMTKWKISCVLDFRYRLNYVVDLICYHWLIHWAI